MSYYAHPLKPSQRRPNLSGELRRNILISLTLHQEEEISVRTAPFHKSLHITHYITTILTYTSLVIKVILFTNLQKLFFFIFFTLNATCPLQRLNTSKRNRTLSSNRPYFLGLHLKSSTQTVYSQPLSILYILTI